MAIFLGMLLVGVAGVANGQPVFAELSPSGEEVLPPPGEEVLPPPGEEVLPPPAEELPSPSEVPSPEGGLPTEGSNWALILGGVVVVGVVAYFLLKKKK